MRRIGIIGLGVIFCQHLMALQQVQDLFSLTAVFDRDPSRVSEALAFCAETGMDGVVGTDNLDTFLENAPETIVIATPPSTHYSIAERCLKARRNILLEKPADTDLGRLDRLYDLSAAQGCLLQVGFHSAYAADLLWFLEHRAEVERRFGLRRLQRIDCRFEDPYVVNGALLAGRDSLGGSYLDSTVNELSVCAALVPLSAFRTECCQAETLPGPMPTVVKSFLRLIDDAGLTIDCHTDWTGGINSKQTRLHYDNGASILLDHSLQHVIAGDAEVLFDNGRSPRLMTQYVNLYRDYFRCLDQRESNQEQSLSVHRLLLDGMIKS